MAVCLDLASTDTCIALYQILEQIYPRTYGPKLERSLGSCFASPAVYYRILAEAAGKQARPKHGLTRESPIDSRLAVVDNSPWCRGVKLSYRGSQKLGVQIEG